MSAKNVILAGFAGAAALYAFVPPLIKIEKDNNELNQAITDSFYSQHRIILSERGFRFGTSQTEIPISLVDLYISGQINDPAQVAKVFNLQATNGRIAIRGIRDNELDFCDIGYVIDSIKNSVVFPHQDSHPSKLYESKANKDEIYIRFHKSEDSSILFPLEYLKLVAQSADNGLKQAPDYQGAYYFLEKDKISNEQLINDSSRYLAVGHVRAARQTQVSQSR